MGKKKPLGTWEARMAEKARQRAAQAQQEAYEKEQAEMEDEYQIAYPSTENFYGPWA